MTRRNLPPRLFQSEDLPLFSGGAYGPAPEPAPVTVPEPEPAQGVQLTIDEQALLCSLDSDRDTLIPYNTPADYTATDLIKRGVLRLCSVYTSGFSVYPA